MTTSFVSNKTLSAPSQIVVKTVVPHVIVAALLFAGASSVQDSDITDIQATWDPISLVLTYHYTLNSCSYNAVTLVTTAPKHYLLEATALGRQLAMIGHFVNATMQFDASPPSPDPPPLTVVPGFGRPPPLLAPVCIKSRFGITNIFMASKIPSAGTQAVTIAFIPSVVVAALLQAGASFVSVSDITDISAAWNDTFLTCHYTLRICNYNVPALTLVTTTPTHFLLESTALGRQFALIGHFDTFLNDAYMYLDNKIQPPPPPAPPMPPYPPLPPPAPPPRPYVSSPPLPPGSGCEVLPMEPYYESAHFLNSGIVHKAMALFTDMMLSALQAAGATSLTKSDIDVMSWDFQTPSKILAVHYNLRICYADKPAIARVSGDPTYYMLRANDAGRQFQSAGKFILGVLNYSSPPPPPTPNIPASLAYPPPAPGPFVSSPPPTPVNLASSTPPPPGSLVSYPPPPSCPSLMLTAFLYSTAPLDNSTVDQLTQEFPKMMVSALQAANATGVSPVDLQFQQNNPPAWFPQTKSLRVPFNLFICFTDANALNAVLGSPTDFMLVITDVGRAYAVTGSLISATLDIHI